MKRISLFLVLATLGFAPRLCAQDAATEERFNKLSAQIEELRAAQELQQKRIADLAREIQSLREQQSQPGTFASQEDLRKVTDKLQEINRNREADKELILKKIEDLGKTVVSPTADKRKKAAAGPADKAGAGGTTPETGYGYYTILPNDTLIGIVKAYKDQGITVTTDQILKANPGLVAEKMVPGRKIWIPGPQQQNPTAPK